ncbi:zinc finger and BTB domain-containing protein 17-like [Phlebotomus papatasi]|uniref:zinc finger and BTB domain-containing protein 17-like n=1 Tax=Phlebotomus papatasi TaxID=29031 RepID=UPI0024838C4E|nr:zinc finger and BTB domain-containing protein 17-like [Phlebotomus papatasi]
METQAENETLFVDCSIVKEEYDIQEENNVILPATDNPGEPSETQRPLKLERKYKCPICGKGFTQPSHAKTHLAVHSTEKTVPCPQCPKKFANKPRLYVHLLSHSNINLPCGICGKVFKSVLHYRRHLKRHTSENKYECEKCGNKFKEKLILQRHIVRVHINEETSKTQCPICNKVLKHEFSLKNHMAIHSERTPFDCQYCSKSFQRKSYLTKHIAQHHKDQEQPKQINVKDLDKEQIKELVDKLYKDVPTTINDPFLCTICKKLFRNLEDIKLHSLQVHSTEYINPENVDAVQFVIKEVREKKHKCSVCDKAYYTQYELNNHMANHTSEKNFSCTQCSKAFGNKLRLYYHLKTHDTTRAIPCHHCDKFFKTAKILRAHLKRVQGTVKSEPEESL